MAVGVWALWVVIGTLAADHPPRPVPAPVSDAPLGHIASLRLPNGSSIDSIRVAAAPLPFVCVVFTPPPGQGNATITCDLNSSPP